MSVKDDLIINPMQLDREWAQLPILYHTYMEEAEVLDAEIRMMKMTLERNDATLDIQLRAQAIESGVKATEGQIKNRIASNTQHIRTQDGILELEKNKKLTQAVCRSLELKKEALKNMVTLYASEYYNSPASVEDAKKFLDKQEAAASKDVRKDVKKSLKRKQKNK